METKLSFRSLSDVILNHISFHSRYQQCQLTAYRQTCPRCQSKARVWRCGCAWWTAKGPACLGAPREPRRSAWPRGPASRWRRRIDCLAVLVLVSSVLSLVSNMIIIYILIKVLRYNSTILAILAMTQTEVLYAPVRLDQSKASGFFLCFACLKYPWIVRQLVAYCGCLALPKRIDYPDCS